MKLPKNRDNDYTREAINARIKFLSKISGHQPEFLNSSQIEPEVARGNIENIIGFAQLPVGVIGPIKINGEHARGSFFVPMATSEGALISSYNRGAHAISLSGGANVVITADSIQRAPYFIFENAHKAKEFTTWLNKNFNQLKNVTAGTTRHGQLIEHHSFLQGRMVFVRLHFSSGDAMGMNMITKASQEICKYICNNFPVLDYAIESNMAVDKKPAQINTILGRGKSLTTEVLLKEKVISRLLHTNAKAIDTAYHRQVAGGHIAGAMGSNGHLANGIAAMFMACGQDLANVSESCVGHIHTEVSGKDLYVSLRLPSLILGTVGGGTSLPTQRECLEIMGCYGKGKARKFAEIAGVALLAGELSLAAAVVAGDFVTAHEKLGRNRPESKPN